MQYTLGMARHVARCYTNHIRCRNCVNGGYTAVECPGRGALGRSRREKRDGRG